MRFTYCRRLPDGEPLGLADQIGKEVTVTINEASGNGAVVAAGYDMMTGLLQVTLEIPDDSPAARFIARPVEDACPLG